MRFRLRRRSSWSVPAALVGTLFGAVILEGAGSLSTDPSRFRATDDVLFDPTILVHLLLSPIDCVDGVFTWNPIQPCSDGSRARVRDLPFKSLIEGSEPRFQGTATITANGNLDPDYAGPVWGEWTLDVGDGAWEGIWFGRRVVKPSPSAPLGREWVGRLRLIGYGTGSVEGLVVKATETVVTFTPLPLPYELLPLLGFPEVCPGGVCPPEGTIEGVVMGTADGR